MIENLQPIEKSHRRDDGCVDVFDVFDTIQGEGPFSGTPATFIRLAGCNLECRACDTDYTSKREWYSPDELYNRVHSLPKRKLIVLTGGEPFRQDFRHAIMPLTQSGRHVQIETNGTLHLQIVGLFSTAEVTVVCSPKTPKLHDQMWDQIDCLKYVVEDGKIDDDGLPLTSVGPQYGRPARPPVDWRGKIFVQPLDLQDEEINRRNRDAAVKSCMDHGYTLCLQTHKLINLP